MVNRITEDFNGATSGDVTTSNSSITNHTGATASTQFTTSWKLEGAAAMIISGAGSGACRWNPTADASRYTTVYVHTPASAPSTSGSFLNMRDSGDTATQWDIRYLTTGQFQLRDSTAGNAQRAIYSASANTDYRIDISVTSGTVTTRIYTGATINSSTTGDAVYSSVSQTYSGGTMGPVNLGDISGNSLGIVVDFFRVENAALAAPYSPPAGGGSGGNVLLNPVAMSLSSLSTGFEEWTGVRPVVSPSVLPVVPVPIGATPTTFTPLWRLKYWSPTLNTWVDLQPFFWSGSAWLRPDASYFDAELNDWVPMNPQTTA